MSAGLFTEGKPCEACSRWGSCVWQHHMLHLWLLHLLSRSGWSCSQNHSLKRWVMCALKYAWTCPLLTQRPEECMEFNLMCLRWGYTKSHQPFEVMVMANTAWTSGTGFRSGQQFGSASRPGLLSSPAWGRTRAVLDDSVWKFHTFSF